MSTFETTYRIAWWQGHPQFDEEFEPEDVMPYYDIYEDGTLRLYIKQISKHWLFFWINIEKIVECWDNNIKINIIETPERKICGE